MEPFSFIHAADLHIDSQFKGFLGSEDMPKSVRDVILGATFESYKNILNLCLEKRVNALLIAGDVYDGEDRNIDAQTTFMRGLKTLSDNGIKSYVCHGNHDPLDGWIEKIRPPAGCHVFGSECETVTLGEEILVHGISYEHKVETRNLVLKFPKAKKEKFNIGLLHANLDNNANHEPYAPCSIQNLRSTKYDYWALGHVHTKDFFEGESSPFVTYPGNSQGRHINEKGPRGVVLVEVNVRGDISRNFFATDVLRWDEISVDATVIDTISDLLETINKLFKNALDKSESRHLITRLVITGTSELNKSLLREGTIENIREILNKDWGTQDPFIWCKDVVNDTRPNIDRTKEAKLETFVGEVIRLDDRIRADYSKLKTLADNELSTSEMLSGLTVQNRILFNKYFSDEDLLLSVDEVKDMIQGAENDHIGDMLDG